jgi:hypothetical protein
MIDHWLTLSMITGTFFEHDTYINKIDNWLDMLQEHTDIIWN